MSAGRREIHVYERLLSMKICRYCDVENPDDDLFCRKCGKKFRKVHKLGNTLKLIFSSIFFFFLGYGLVTGGFWVWDYFTQPTFIQIEGNTEYDVSVLPVENEIRLAVSTDADRFQTEFPDWISFSDEVSPADSVFLLCQLTKVTRNGQVQSGSQQESIRRRLLFRSLRLTMRRVRLLSPE